jgi:hypothetical protein
VSTPDSPPSRPVEDYRIAEARKALARAKAAVEDEFRPYNPAEEAGRLQFAVEMLLDYIGEQVQS